jgi:HlyD family type I secretion membrane fusion protein
MTRAMSRSTAFRDMPMAPSPDLEDEGGGFGRPAILICFAAVAGALIWAGLTPVREIVSADGVVLPEGFMRRVEHLEGGIVGAVLVQEGAAVAAGQALVRLDQASLGADSRRMQARHEGLMREIDRQLVFASGGAPAPLAETGAIARSQHAAADVAEAHREARLRVLRSEVELRAAEMKALVERRGALRAELDIVTGRFQQYDDTHRRSGAISGVQRDNAELQKIQIEREVATLESDIRAADLRVRMAMENEAEFLAAARKEALLRVAELEAQRAEVAEELGRIEAALERGLVVAPVAGRVQTLGALNAGQVLAPGALVAEIVPADADLFVEVRLPADQIGDVAVGMEASIKALTYDYLKYGDVPGVIDSISPSSAADPDGLLRYRLKIRLDADGVGQGESARPLQPGMTVVAEMRAGAKTVLEFLLRPLKIIRDKALTES